LNDISKPILKILVAGGCHVFGYPIGKEYAFTSIAARRLSAWADVQMDCVRANANLSGVIVDSLIGRPADVVVLQIGNLECPMHVRRHFYKRFRKKSGSGGGSGGGADLVKVASDEVYAPSPRARLKILDRIAYNLVVIVLRRPLYDPENFRTDYGCLLDNIAETGVPMVIAISPLPCVDSMHMHYRLRGAKLVCQAAESRGMLYLDSAQALGGARTSQAHGLHCHVLHLGREGQRLLGESPGPYG